MEINLIRYCYSRWGIMGVLFIEGFAVCHSCEHPKYFLSSGKYKLEKEGGELRILSTRKKRPTLCAGNGPFSFTDGSIIVGKYLTSGVLVHSQASYTAIFKRILWYLNKKESITLTIQDKKL